ncbi:MAG: hypothetical protein JO249_13025 [Acidobacteria bacterium]|nr:hypothetical protein [Acidobacteriota bacterium]MBV9481658.1 hypothetical protein [Acidobacteriota bacterium]
MIRKTSKASIVLSILAAVPLLAFAGGHVMETGTSAVKTLHEIRDEADPDDVQACYALGRLDITFRTEKNGPPAVGLVMTDPRGRRIGFDPLKKHGWQELPKAQGFIDCETPDAQNACLGIIQVCGPISGTYKLEVIARQTTEYSLDISGRSQEVRERQALEATSSRVQVNSVAIRQGSRDMVLLSYSRDPSSKIALQSSPAAPLASNQ